MENLHFQNLVRVYQNAEIHKGPFAGSDLEIEPGKALVRYEAKKCWQHGGGGIHGAIYFKLLDEAAYFAAQSLEKEWFLLTAHFQIQFLRSNSGGILRAEGNLKNKSRHLFIAEARLFLEQGKELGFGIGNFMKSDIRLAEMDTYRKE
jgi:uncharacterized protein (TIGR00369 family)